jgi:hypothetical protein
VLSRPAQKRRGADTDPPHWRIFPLPYNKPIGGFSI